MARAPKKALTADEKTAIKIAVDAFQAAEMDIARVMEKAGGLPVRIDDAARFCNSNGRNVRGCELGEAHAEIGRALLHLSMAQEEIMRAHCMLISYCNDNGLPLPQPSFGGR